MSKSKIVVLAACAATVLLIVVGSLVYVADRNSPRRQLARARELSLTDKLDAMELVRSIIKTSKGNSPDAQLFECQLLLDLNRGREANNAFTLIHHPEVCDPEALNRLAEKAQSFGMSAMAARAFTAAGDFVRNNPQRMKNLIYALYSQREQTSENQILMLCEEYSQRWPDDAYPWIISAGLYSERNVPSRAANSLREALKHEIPPGEVNRLRISLAQYSMQLGDLQTSREQCDILEASILDKESADSLPLVLAELFLREGKPAKALEVVDKLPEPRASAADVRAMRGRCRFELDDYQGAIRELTEAIRLNDFDQQSHYLLGQAYLKIKNQELANIHLNRSLQLNDLTAKILTLENELRNDLNNRQLKLKLATLNEQRGNPDKAAAWRRGAMKSQ